MTPDEHPLAWLGCLVCLVSCALFVWFVVTAALWIGERLGG